MLELQLGTLGVVAGEQAHDRRIGLGTKMGDQFPGAGERVMLVSREKVR